MAEPHRLRVLSRVQEAWWRVRKRARTGNVATWAPSRDYRRPAFVEGMTRAAWTPLHRLLRRSLPPCNSAEGCLTSRLEFCPFVFPHPPRRRCRCRRLPPLSLIARIRNYSWVSKATNETSHCRYPRIHRAYRRIRLFCNQSVQRQRRQRVCCRNYESRKKRLIRISYCREIYLMRYIAVSIIWWLLVSYN